MNRRIPLTEIPWSIALLALPAKIYGVLSNLVAGRIIKMGLCLLLFILLLALLDMIIMESTGKSLIIDFIRLKLGVVEHAVPKDPLPLRPH